MASATPLTGLSHLDLSVSDRRASAEWYADVLGFEIRGDRFNEAAGLPWVHVGHPCGLTMGLVEHPDNSGEPFDEHRTGLDHVSFAVVSREAIDELARRAADHGCAARPSETDDAVLVALRDPDNIHAGPNAAERVTERRIPVWSTGRPGAHRTTAPAREATRVGMDVV